MSTLLGAFAGLVVLIGLGMAVFGLIRWTSSRSLANAGHRATGVVVDNQMVSRQERGLTFRPVVTFRTADGEDVTTTILQPRHRSYVVGRSIEVVYHPNNPTKADLAEGYRSIGVPSALGGLVIAAIGIGFFFLIQSATDSAPTVPGFSSNAPQYPTNVTLPPNFQTGFPTFR
ncbi:DUF3592 domain-containing protein [Solihabitans fulvus]|nr:DUF3592 domain-containing protein [Solihabitans fulvus]